MNENPKPLRRSSIIAMDVTSLILSLPPLCSQPLTTLLFVSRVTMMQPYLNIVVNLVAAVEGLGAAARLDGSMVLCRVELRSQKGEIKWQIGESEKEKVNGKNRTIDFEANSSNGGKLLSLPIICLVSQITSKLNLGQGKYKHLKLSVYHLYQIA